MEVYWVWLSGLEGLGTRGRIRVLSAFGTPERAYRATEAELREAAELTAEDRAALMDRDLGPAEKILRECREKDIRVIPLDSPDYPALLAEISDPPPVLYCAGVLPDTVRELTIAVVGTRKASAQGLRMAKKLGYELSRAGTVVVSGCAEGADRAAMEGALRGGSAVIGVLGCGVDVVYPKSCRRLYADVRDYGCLLSEYPPGTPPISWHFPARNRIISGLSRGVIVTEAPRRSGALITARLAMEQGRDVFAVPGSAGLPACAGSNDLLRQGAAMAESGADVTQGYEYLFPDRLRVPDRGSELQEPWELTELPDDGNEVIAASPVCISQSCDKKDIDKAEVPAYIDVQELAAPLDPEEAAVAAALLGGPRRTDELIRATGLTAPKVIGILTMLELRGVLTALPGGSYSLKETH